MLKKTASDLFFKSLHHLQVGQLSITTPDGKIRFFEGKEKGETASFVIKEWTVLSNLMRKGDIGFAEDYKKGHWDTDNLVGLMMIGLLNKPILEKFIFGTALSRLFSMLSYLLKLNTLKGSKKNIHAHYDLGNHFYELWLDPSMTYSSGIFNEKKDSLEQAQYNKYDRILQQLTHSSGRLLEIGCGWGGFAERGIQKGDFDIKGITLSHQQLSYAQKRLSNKASFVLEDYRHQKGTFDHIVSIEMFEAVGERYWSTYFKKVAELLKVGGKALVQTITIHEKDFAAYKRSGDFIRTYIFPGGMLPTPTRFTQEAKKAGLLAKNPFYFGQDYAQTLRLWLKAFDAKKSEVMNLGFDEEFTRLWRFYLASCIAGFESNQTNVMQIELSHA